MTAVVLGRVRALLGDDGIGRLLDDASSPRTVAYLQDIGNWVSYGEAIALLEAGMRLTGDAAFARHVGEDFVRRLAGSSNSGVLLALGSPEALLRSIGVASHRFSTAADLECAEVRAGYAEIHATAAPGFTRHRLHCDWTAGLLTQATVLFGLPPATVEEDGCQTEGAPACRFRITWDPAGGGDSDPAGEIRALREQLDGMSARLQSIFDVAADLIGSDDLQGTLARITERAAQQVRAPRHVLAVRASDDAELRCHQKGFTSDEARDVAERALAGGSRAVPDHWLVAEVRSHRHHYGVLVAVHADGARFFAHERQLLEVYARYAATALDSATALAEARARHLEALRRDEESRTLLELARRLARAGSTDQIAARLADAVSGVIDCDRVSVYLWDPGCAELVRRAIKSTGRGGDLEACAARVRPAEVPQLQSWLERPDPEPVFIDLETSPVRVALRELGTAAAVAVPIATERRFLGCLVVSVRDRPQRLAPSPELVDRLSGVAAHAVPALENGRLVDDMTHQARHDQLTGAVNRIGFHETLSAATRARDRAAAALFYIDLDGFKPVNDAHGHDVGDALLCAVVERLRASVRDGDTVARLGGDEFAVLAEGIADAAQLELVSARLEDAFARPFAVPGRSFSVTASIGRAVWPVDGDGPEALLRRADAAMYDVKRSAHERAVAAS